MAKHWRVSKDTQRGIKAEFGDNLKVTLVDGILSFYTGRELVGTKDFPQYERENFVNFIYSLCEKRGIKKNQIRFDEI